MKNVTIIPVLNGFIVKVGCQEVVFTSVEALAHELVRYQVNPVEVELEYIRNALNPQIGSLQRQPGGIIPSLPTETARVDTRTR